MRLIDKKRIEQADRNVKGYLSDGLIKTGEKEHKKYVQFFLDQAEKSLRTATLLHEISTNEATKKAMKVESGFESHLWVIVTSYYSMFYAALALLANEGIKVGEQIVHKTVVDALIHYFISNRRLAKMLESYEDAKQVSLQLIGREELMRRVERKADELIVSYERERGKRSRFQYDVGEMARSGYAQTSLTRAREFVSEIRVILSK
jgi:uncharacterized protein (UPF0332 family)